MRLYYFSVVIFLLTAGSIACQKRFGVVRTAKASDSRNAMQPEKPEPLQTRTPLRLPLENPQIVVLKSKRQLELYANGTLVRTYKVGLGFNPLDDKKQEGDGCTPEGDFYIFVKNAKSAYYLSLGISYPNSEDAERGLHDGLITRAERNAIVNAIRKRVMPPQHTALGGEIYIHGNGAGSDWTWGCVALENADIGELYNAVSVGTPVKITP